MRFAPIPLSRCYLWSVRKRGQPPGRAYSALSVRPLSFLFKHREWSSSPLVQINVTKCGGECPWECGSLDLSSTSPQITPLGGIALIWPCCVLHPFFPLRIYVWKCNKQNRVVVLFVSFPPPNLWGNHWKYMMSWSDLKRQMRREKGILVFFFYSNSTMLPSAQVGEMVLEPEKVNLII